MSLQVDVLIVDDDDDLVQLFKMLLEAEGWACTVAHNGLTALQSIAIVHPRVMILDLVMPTMDGYSVLARLPSQHLPVIVVTGASVSLGGIASTVAVLTKPVEADALVSAVRNVLDVNGRGKG